MPRQSGIEKIIHEQRNVAANRVAGAQESNDVVIEGVGFGIGADGHANGAVGAGCAPEFIAGFHIALPLDYSAYFFFAPGFNRIGWAIVRAFFADFTKMLDAEINRTVFI